jgi:hypothetical protein
LTATTIYLPKPHKDRSVIYDNSVAVEIQFSSMSHRTLATTVSQLRPPL